MTVGFPRRNVANTRPGRTIPANGVLRLLDAPTGLTASAGAADALAAAWTAGAGQVLAVVDWPAAAASWLRPAQRLADNQPDAWILADTPAGCAQLASRLTGQPGWTPGRTFGFASVATPNLLALTPPGALAGMTGATAAGGSWRIGQSLLLVNDDPEGATGADHPSLITAGIMRPVIIARRPRPGRQS